ncbi:MAG TPA: pirin family protein, partial [Microbacterium sp.]|nr:pirin family protein [Microbacterium sp.]
MTRLDAGPEETLRQAADPDGTSCDGPRALLLEAREVPLGGVRAMSVHRSLPQRALPMVGAWCFLDRFGPQT